MGFPVEFNHVVVLKDDDETRLFLDAVAKCLDSPTREIIIYKNGARIYPMGYDIPVATKSPEMPAGFEEIGYARVIQQSIDELGEDLYRTRLRLGSVRGLSNI